MLQLPDVARIDLKLKWSGIGVSLAIFGLAALIGLQALWNNDPIWGGWSSRFLAFLWGLGLHQFTFDGISGLTDKLVGNVTP